MSKKLKNKDKERDAILDEWHDVLGINECYGINETNDDNSLILAFNGTSLDYKGAVDFMLAIEKQDMCFLVEEFLTNYQDVYLNHIANRVIHNFDEDTE